MHTTRSNDTARTDSTPIKEQNVPNKKQVGKKGDKPEPTPKSTPTGKATKKIKGGGGGDTTKSQTAIAKTQKPRGKHGTVVLFMPYLHYETHDKRKEMSRAIERAKSKPPEGGRRQSIYGSKDQMLIHAYLHSTPNLHIRRTLDQFYYHAISTEDRDEDQVVWRYTRDKYPDKKLFMVDQLWLWIL